MHTVGCAPILRLGARSNKPQTLNFPDRELGLRAATLVGFGSEHGVIGRFQVGAALW